VNAHAFAALELARAVMSVMTLRILPGRIVECTSGRAVVDRDLIGIAGGAIVFVVKFELAHDAGACCA